MVTKHGKLVDDLNDDCGLILAIYGLTMANLWVSNCYLRVKPVELDKHHSNQHYWLFQTYHFG